jgi:hypothetical protein
MNPADIPGFDPSRDDHVVALAAVRGCLRLFPDPEATRATITANWEAWARFTYTELPKLLGVTPGPIVRVQGGNRKARRAKRR